MNSTAQPQTPTVQIKSILPWVIWSLGCLFYFYESLLQVSLNAINTELMHDFSITSQMLGLMAGLYFYAYAFMQLPAGMLMDYFGPKRLLVLATLLCSVSTIGFGLTESYLMACIARFMIGLGSAFAAVGTMKLSANWFHADKFAFLTGLMVTIGMLGAMGGETPLALLVDSIGWRNTMITMGLSGIIIALFLIFIAKDSPNKTSTETKSIRVDIAKEISFLQSFKVLLKNKDIWLVALYGGLMYLPTPVFCGLWSASFLMTKFHITKAVATNYTTLVFIGWAISSPLFGIFSDRIQRRKPPMFIASIGSLICISTFILLPVQSPLIVQFALFGFGFFSGGFLPAFAVAKELCNKKYVATGLSFMNMMNMIGIALAQPFVGRILDNLWTGEMVGNVRVYSLGAYQTALSILPAGILIALCLLPFIKETNCKNINE